jgi:3-oxoacyl-[acyl-carrier protein] reductase
MRALITGAGAPGGIGMACARALGAAGYEVVITATTGRIFARAAELQAEGISVSAHQADLTDALAVARLLTQAGPVDVLVNNAGMGSVGQPAELVAFAEGDMAHSGAAPWMPLSPRRCWSRGPFCRGCWGAAGGGW